MATRVKICGVTRLRDAELAAELGAWAIGMVFYEPSPRCCSQREALSIASALRRRVELCGVFVNAPLERVVDTSEELGLTLLQLHGDEGPAYCAEAGHRTGARVIKAGQVATAGDVRALERFHVDFHLLDAKPRAAAPRANGHAAPPPQQLRGGTGETFAWTLLRARRTRIPLILSGGLRPTNVAAAIASAGRALGERGGAPGGGPFAVDTASGVEAAPGRKDPELLRGFFTEVQRLAVGSPA